MGISRWDPSKDLSLMQERLNRLFSDPNDTSPEMAEGARYLPPVDIVETCDDVVLRVELPGVDKSDIDVQIDNDVLILKGERKFEKEVDQEHYYRMECSYGTFQRTFTLPRSIQKEKIQANMDRGILEIRLPKEPQDKKIQVSVD
ncbi:MAG: Hsp20/alpha crystallin family protein [bacterium]|nr:Hsp20/alpha crystallin family protein [bacterium]